MSKDKADGVETIAPEDRNVPTDAAPTAAAEAGAIDISFSPGLTDFLARSDIAIGFTSYQTGRLYLIGRGPDDKLALHEAVYPQAMGLTGDGSRIYLGTLTQIVRMENVLAPGQRANQMHDKVYVPRNLQTTGNVDIHEIGIQANGRIVFVNTRFNCLCEPSLTHSFRPVWKPDFISRLVAEDRCHLNGLAMVDGKPKYVSAASRSNVIDGWRDHREDGGLIIDVESQAILAEGLSMPHSPRFHDGRVWLLNSGTGELGWLDPAGGNFVPLAFFPGFLRGLAFHGEHAFVTLSKPRKGHFEGLALDGRLAESGSEAWCGVQIVSQADGAVAHWLRFEGAITELFDICVLPGVQNPITLGPNSVEIRDFLTIEPGAI